VHETGGRSNLLSPRSGFSTIQDIRISYKNLAANAANEETTLHVLLVSKTS